MIVMRDGNIIEARVAEISDTEIRYRRFSHLDGPVIVVSRANVLSIRYQNGTIEVITAGTATDQGTVQPESISSLQPEDVSSSAISTQQDTRDLSIVPVLGQPNILQQALNLLPAIPISGQTLKFQFGGEAWLATLNGRNLFTGYLTLRENDEGVIVLTLQQTHTFGLRWMQTPGAEIVLEYTRGPPTSLKFISRSQGDREGRERRERGGRTREGEDGEDSDIGKAYMNSLGLTIGTALPAPALIGTLNGTIAPFRNTFFELGLEMGGITGQSSMSHFSLYPHGRFNVFVPFSSKSGWYAGAGCGYAYVNYDIHDEFKVSGGFFLADFSTGFIFSGFTFSYSLRTNFSTANSKFSMGYLYRFNKKENNYEN